MITNTPSDHRPTRWHFRITGYFWILCGLAGTTSVLINHVSGLAVDDLPRLLVCVTMGCCLIFVGYGLSQGRRWGKIWAALFSSVMVLVFFDMIVMFAVHKNVLGIAANFVGIAMGIYTLAVVVFIRS